MADDVGTAVKYSTHSDLRNSQTAVTAGNYITSVRLHSQGIRQA